MLAKSCCRSTLSIDGVRLVCVESNTVAECQIVLNSSKNVKFFKTTNKKSNLKIQTTNLHRILPFPISATWNI